MRTARVLSARETSAAIALLLPGRRTRCGSALDKVSFELRLAAGGDRGGTFMWKRTSGDEGQNKPPSLDGIVA
jgi:hypothetical protein